MYRITLDSVFGNPTIDGRVLGSWGAVPSRPSAELVWRCAAFRRPWPAVTMGHGVACPPAAREIAANDAGRPASAGEAA